MYVIGLTGERKNWKERSSKEELIQQLIFTRIKITHQA
jgi:hypothetical protein